MSDTNDPLERLDEQWERLYNKASAERDRLGEINAELLEACRMALPFVVRHYTTVDGENLREFLETAIARAEGNTQPNPAKSAILKQMQKEF